MTEVVCTDDIPGVSAGPARAVTERLRACAPDMERPGADLIAHYLDPDRLPVAKRWSRRHADTQRRLCQRFAAPVIAAVSCQDITVGHMQQIVSAAPTASEGERLHRCLSAMVTAGIKGGYLASPRLREVHWQAGDRPVPEPEPSTSGESALWVDPAEIPAAADIARLGQALAAGRRGELDELMANTAAYSGLRQGELFALTTGQVAPDARVITVDRKLIEVAGQLYVEAPKYRKYRSTIYPVRTPHGYPLAEQARRPDRAGPRRAAGRHQPARADLPQPEVQALAVLQLRPPRPGARLPGRRLARRRTATATGPGTACGTCSAPPPCSPGNSTPPTCPAWPATPTTASPSTCTSAPPRASWTAPAKPPNNHTRPR